jgi:hypothetical protein
MKTWTRPISVGQKFAANDYVAACYRIYCCTPHGNDSCDRIFADLNGNGVYEAGIDPIAIQGPTGTELFHGCQGYHDVRGEAIPGINGFARVAREEPEMILPVFYWYGDVTDSVKDDPMEGSEADFHVADMANPNAIVIHDNPNYS